MLPSRSSSSPARVETRRAPGLPPRRGPVPVQGIPPRGPRPGAPSSGGPGRGWLWAVAAGLVVAGLLIVVGTARGPVLTPRHRAEALTFSLARSRFAPPMEVEPSAALVRGRFSPQTPPGVAAREAMGFRDEMVIQERTARIGDYDVDVLWLRLPGRQEGHWLVVAWMEGSDLALCNFRFASTETDLTPEELLWGQRLLSSILMPENFRLGVVPDFRLRGEPPKVFGPSKSS
jgi:hypothetical protein